MKEKKNNVSYSVKVSTEIKDKIEAIAKEQKWKQTVVMEVAINDLFNRIIKKG